MTHTLFISSRSRLKGSTKNPILKIALLSHNPFISDGFANAKCRCDKKSLSSFKLCLINYTDSNVQIPPCNSISHPLHILHTSQTYVLSL